MAMTNAPKPFVRHTKPGETTPFVRHSGGTPVAESTTDDAPVKKAPAKKAAKAE